MTLSMPDLQMQLRELRTQHAAGKLSSAKYHAARKTLERQLIELVVEGDGDVPVQATSGVVAARSGLSLYAGLTVVVLILASAGYAWTGSPDHIFEPPAATATAAPAASHEMGQAQMEAMTERLAERLKTRPDDADGWLMLGRSYGALGRHAEALSAFERVMKLMPDDAGVLADYADAMAAKNGRSLDAAAMQYVDKALRIDPNHLKALALAGTAAFNRGDFAAAVQYWDRAVQAGPGDHPMVQQLRAGVTEARERGGLPAAVPANTSLAAAVPAVLTGTVSLAPALQGQASPDDTVFIFARAASGSRMPLAIVRTRVRDLPYRYTLDDSLAMSPAARLSSVASVVVGARVSKSAQATPQPGDLEGLSAPTANHGQGLNIVIAEVVKELPK